MKIRAVACCAALLFAGSAFAQDAPMPKMFKGMQAQQKGQYQMEILEGGGRGAKDGTRMTICTDNLMKQSGADKGKPRPESNCKQRLLKDAADEAVMEITCPDTTTTMTMKRESAKTMLMTVSSKSAKGETRNVKMRYTHLGPCREGQGVMSLDPKSEECKKIKQQAAQMDPKKQCAGAGDQRATCEKQMRDAVAQMSAMCS